jgi:lysophospholipase L1-like esterase
MADAGHETGAVKVVFYGDSIVDGWKAISSPERRWSTLVSEQLGWDELNVSRGGMGFVRWRSASRGEDGRRLHSADELGLLADVLDSDADACVVALGGNDQMLLREDRLSGEDRWRPLIAHAIERDLRMIVERFGAENTVVLDLYTWWAEGEESPGWRAARELLVGGGAVHGLDLVPGLRTPLVARPELLGADGIHPNDDGHAALAASVLPHLAHALGRDFSPEE